MYDLVDVWDELPIMRHIGFLVVGSKLALDGEQKDLEIPLLLKPERETENFSLCYCYHNMASSLSIVPYCVGHAESTNFVKKNKKRCLAQGHFNSMKTCSQGGLTTLLALPPCCPVSWPFITLRESTVWTPGCLIQLQTNIWWHILKTCIVNFMVTNLFWKACHLWLELLIYLLIVFLMNQLFCL